MGVSTMEAHGCCKTINRPRTRTWHMSGGQLVLFLEKMMQTYRLEPHLTQDGIHHDQQADSNRDAHTDKRTLLQRRAGLGNQIRQYDAEGHGEQDPDDKEAVEEGEAFQRGYGGRPVAGWCCCECCSEASSWSAICRAVYS